MVSAIFLGPAPAPAPSDPLGEALLDLGTRLDPSWFLLALLIPVAIVVLWFGNRMLSSWRQADAFEPKGRGHAGKLHARAPASAAWVRTRGRLREAPPVPIATAQAGPVRVTGVIVAATETLGGAPEHGCVWRNRRGAPPASAVAATAVVLADDSGKAGVENLEGARVFAPTEPLGRGHDSLALYVGDQVEVLGTFTPQRVGDDPDPTQNIYGTLGTSGPLEIQVLDRPWSDAQAGDARPRGDAPAPTGTGDEPAAPHEPTDSTTSFEPETSQPS